MELVTTLLLALLGRLSTRCWNIAERTCFRALMLGDSAFKFIPKVFDWVEVRALCRPVKFFHTDLDKPFLYGLRFVHGGLSC